MVKPPIVYYIRYTKERRDVCPAFLCLTLFLRLNGVRLAAAQADATRIMFDVAAGKLDIDGLAEWIRNHLARQ